MSYPEVYRKRVLEYRQEGHTLDETHQVFKVAVCTIREWENRLKTTGNLNVKIPEHPFKKIDPEKLKEYVKLHPDAYQKEMAKEFSCSQSAIHNALARLNITRKKKRHTIRNRIKTQ